jgi:hypothetical protein
LPARGYPTYAGVALGCIAAFDLKSDAILDEYEASFYACSSHCPGKTLEIK